MLNCKTVEMFDDTVTIDGEPHLPEGYSTVYEPIGGLWSVEISETISDILGLMVCRLRDIRRRRLRVLNANRSTARERKINRAFV